MPSCGGGRAPVELTTEAWSVWCVRIFRSLGPLCRCARKGSSALNFPRSLEPWWGSLNSCRQAMDTDWVTSPVWILHGILLIHFKCSKFLQSRFDSVSFRQISTFLSSTIGATAPMWLECWWGCRCHMDRIKKVGWWWRMKVASCCMKYQVVFVAAFARA